MAGVPQVCVVRDKVRGTQYEIVVQPGVTGEAGRRFRSLFRSSKVVVITDDTVGPLYLPALRAALEGEGLDVIVATVPAGEAHKSIRTVASIYDQVLPRGIDRATPVVALGGGVVGDMAGFVAATVLRGVPFVQVPTTLLAMVDASVGGKTGVDHAVGKNLLGAFHQPSVVLIDPEALRTLPARELRSGLAECIKHEVIRDAEGFAHLEANIGRATALDLGYLTELVAHNVGIKARVVEDDPFEHGDRAHLNFGHTIGHAIESVSGYAYAHGECVALGMVAAGRMAVRLGMLDAASCDRIVGLVAAAGLPTGMGGGTVPALPIDRVLETMLFDKKVKAGKVRFVLPDRLGHVVIRDDVPPQLVREAVESLT